MRKKVIGITVGTSINPQAVINKSKKALQIDQNTNDIRQLYGDVENLKNSENYVDDDGYLVLGSNTTIDADGYINL